MTAKTKSDRIRRLFAVYDKRSEEHVRSYELPHFNLKEMQQLFRQKPGDGMYYCYLITAKEAPYFRKKYGLRFHFKKREYFLETREY